MRSDSKIEQLCFRLRELALERGPDSRLPTVDELCVLLGTSRVTLTEVLKQLESQQVIYRQHSKGIFVSPHIHRQNIGIILNSTFFTVNGASPFWGMLWGRFAGEARKREAMRDLSHSFYGAFQGDEQIVLPEECRQLVLAGRLQGVLAIGLAITEIEWILKQKVPCVVFAGAGPWAVELDHIQFVRMAMRVIVQQHCHAVEFWLHDYYETSEQDDFVDLLADIEANQALIFDSVRLRVGRKGTTVQEQGYQVAMSVFGQPQEVYPDGIIILNDMMMEGVLAAFQVLGIRTGQDVKIVTHANADAMPFFTSIPGVTVIEFDSSDIVQTMFTMLDTLMAGQTPAVSPVRIPPRFRKRT